MSNINKKYIGSILIALIAFFALAVQYSKVNADTFHNEIPQVISEYSTAFEILGGGDDSGEDSISHPLSEPSIRKYRNEFVNAVNYKNVQSYSYFLPDMMAMVGYYEYEYETHKQALMTLKEVDANWTAHGAQPIKINGITAYEIIHPDDTNSVTYWQLTVYKNSLYMLVVDGYNNYSLLVSPSVQMDDEYNNNRQGVSPPPVQKVFQDILSEMN